MTDEDRSCLHPHSPPHHPHHTTATNDADMMLTRYGMVIPVRRRLGGCRRLNSNLPTTVLTTRECRTLTYDGCEEWITSYLHC